MTGAIRFNVTSCTGYQDPEKPKSSSVNDHFVKNAIN